MAIKKVLQDRRYKNRELQLMRTMDHANVVALKHCFFSTTTKDELFLNLVMEYVPETIYRVLKHYSNVNQRMPLIYVKLYTYQVRAVLPSRFSVSTLFAFLILTWDYFPDLQGASIYAHRSWGMPPGLEASEYSGMLFLNYPL